jgi:Domain of unknown function (DUF222)
VADHRARCLPSEFFNALLASAERLGYGSERMYDEHIFAFGEAHRQLRRAVDVWTTGELADGLKALAGLRAALDACEARVLARFDAAHGWEADGACDAASWLRAQTGTSQRDAAGRVRTADGLAALPSVAGALADGMITHGHASTLARAAERSPDVADAQAELLQRAVGQSADAFERTVRSWELRRAADGGAAAFERQHARRSATTVTVEDGMTLLQARLDPVAGSTVTSALDRIAEELWRQDVGGDGARVLDLHVRRADALVEMARRAMAVDPPSAKRPDPSVVVLIDHETLAGQLAAAGVCELADGTAIAPETARRLACTAGILPVVLDGKSRPLDLGVTQRFATPAQRVALMVRDGACVFPDCNRPRWMCDAHHLIEHPTGPTDLENLALVCDAHHHLVHEGGWTLEPLPDGGWLARSPAGVERRRPPRRRPSPDPPAPPSMQPELDLLAS